jgi:ubiquinone/menaquinone biosynthesis C-methylase UbiE
MSSPSIVLGLVALTALGAIVWRVASRRQSLPCPSWLGWFVELDNPFTKINRAHAIVRSLDLRPGMHVLDVGCGPGRITLPIAEAVQPGEVVAMDIQPGMLARVRDRAQAAQVENVRLLEAGAGEGKLGRAQFDRAVLVTVLGEIPNQAAAMREVFDALKPGGMLSVTEVVFDPHFQTRRTVRRLSAAAGFREKQFLGGALAYTLVLEKGGT